MEPTTVLTAAAIAQLAFSEFVKSGAGELAKKSLEGAGELIKQLREKIRLRFQGNKKAETALATIEQGETTALTKLEVYLEDEMTDDPAFAEELRQVAQKIVNIQNQSTSTRQYNNYGRDQISIETIQGDATIGGS